MNDGRSVWLTHWKINDRSQWDNSSFEEALLKYGLENNKTVYRACGNGFFTKKTIRAILDLATSFGARTVIQSSPGARSVYLWDDGCLAFFRPEHAVKGYRMCAVASLNEEAIKQFCLLLKRHRRDKRYVKGARPISAIVKSGSGLDIVEIGKIYAPLIKENYIPGVVAAYKEIAKAITTDCPVGRLSIIDGIAGCGKSYIIRALITEFGDQVEFVLLPGDMVTEFGRPEMLPFLAMNRRFDDRPLCLILEDADALLVERKADNMVAMAATLNLGDGLLGDALNIRLLATTNSPMVEIDKAMTRSGRLAHYVTIGKLGVDQARQVLSRLKPDSKETINTPMTLADIYALARGADGAADFDHKPVGFSGLKQILTEKEDEE